MAKKPSIRTPKPQSGKKIKAPKATRGKSTDHLYPQFCLRSLRGNYCLTACTKDQQAAFALTLHRLSNLSWKDITYGQRHGLGSEKIARNAIRGARVPDEVTEDTPLLAIRFAGKAPMVGYRSGQIFHVLWLDRNFSLYKH